MTANENEIPFWSNENVLKTITVMVAQQCESSKNPSTVPF